MKFYTCNHEIIVLDIDWRSEQACYSKSDFAEQLSHPLTLEQACYHLTIYPRAPSVAQRRRSLSEEKASTAAKVVEDLVKPDFVKEVKYTTWLSNVVLVKKASGK